MSVESFFKTLDDEHRLNVILSHMQYPKTSKLCAHDKPVLTSYYTCEADGGSNRCDFSKVKKDIMEDPELRAFGATSVAKMIVDEIEKHQEEFIPHRFDGFQIYRGGYDIVRVQRKEGTGPETACTSGRMGFIEYNDLRRDAMEATSRARQEMVDQAVMKTVNMATKPFCCIQ